MNVRYSNPGIDNMIESILAFQADEEAPYWFESLYYFYPQIDKAYARNLPLTDRNDYIEQKIRETYNDLEDEINHKAELYNDHWRNNKKQIEEALSDAFEIDCALLFNDLKCNVSLNPISPRFLLDNSFEVFYLNSERGAIGMSIHEIIHFVWFYTWNKVFDDSYDEYERPSLKWILSEMVVESIMKDTRLSSINPYFPRENGGCIYSYFFDMKANGISVIDAIDKMYQENDIKNFMKKSYEFCLENEKEIRKHIELSEQINA